MQGGVALSPGNLLRLMEVPISDDTSPGSLPSYIPGQNRIGLIRGPLFLFFFRDRCRRFLPRQRCFWTARFSTAGIMPCSRSWHGRQTGRTSSTVAIGPRIAINQVMNVEANARSRAQVAFPAVFPEGFQPQGAPVVGFEVFAVGELGRGHKIPGISAPCIAISWSAC